MIWAPAKPYQYTIFFCRKRRSTTRQLYGLAGGQIKGNGLHIAEARAKCINKQYYLLSQHYIKQSTRKKILLLVASWIHRRHGKYLPRRTPHALARGNFFVQLFNRISPDIVMSLCWRGHHIWGPYGAISAGLGHGRGRSSAWGYRGEQSWPTADRSISWPNGSAIVPFVF